MKKLESSLKNMILSLTGFTVAAGALLGWVNRITAEPIARAKAKTLSDAIAVVVPGFDNNPAEHPDTVDWDGGRYIVYKATQKGQFIGAAIESSANGFGGALTVLVGFDKEGKIIDYSLLSHAETPGLGSKAADWFKKGHKGDIIGLNPGESPLVVSKDGGNVDAITAATVTSRAFLNAINAAYAAYAVQNGLEVGEELNGSTGASKKGKQQEDGGDQPNAATGASKKKAAPEKEEKARPEATTGASKKKASSSPAAPRKEVKARPEATTGASKKKNAKDTLVVKKKKQNETPDAATGASKRHKQESGKEDVVQ